MPNPERVSRPRQAPQGASSLTGATRSPTLTMPARPHTRTPPRRRNHQDLLTVVQTLQPRDQVVAALLVEHRALTTAQIAAVLFDSLATAKRRLYRLRQLGWVDRFTPIRPGRPRQTHWVAGLLAARFMAVHHAAPPPTPRAWRDRVEAIAASSHLDHSDGTHEVFIALLTHTRRHRPTRLARWWGPARSAAAVGQRLHPDGHGVWTEHHRQVGFWLEYDTGTEPLHRLVTKLDPYARLRRDGGPDYPVLFWLPNPTRESHLHHRLRDHARDLGTTVATTHPSLAEQDDGPAGPIWQLTTDPPGTRRRLIDLPSDPGTPGPYHPGPPTPDQDPLHLLDPSPDGASWVGTQPN